MDEENNIQTNQVKPLGRDVVKLILLALLIVSVLGNVVLGFLWHAQTVRVNKILEEEQASLNAAEQLQEDTAVQVSSVVQTSSAETTSEDKGQATSGDAVQAVSAVSAVSTSEEEETDEEDQKIDLTNLEDVDAETLVDESKIDFDHLEQYFQSYEISSELMSRIFGEKGSYKPNCTVPASDLRYLKVLHYDYKGKIRVGEIMVNTLLEDDILYIFQKLFENKYQIEKMYLVDNYGADDDTSVNDNNTSCFNFRTATDTDTLSNHATGCAIDINPLQNPYFRVHDDGTFDFDNTDADLYWDRTKDPESRHMINHDDLCYQLFTERGFTWGGDWQNPIDYQHFEKAVY